MDDDARYEVLRNDEEQYSLWLVGLDVPAGWYRVGKEGSKGRVLNLCRRGVDGHAAAQLARADGRRPVLNKPSPDHIQS